VRSDETSWASTGAVPSVSVIIPTRNRVALLGESIASVRGQSLHDWEVVVVDDNSEDSTWDWVGSLQDPRIRAVRLLEHSERSVARNHGLAIARSEFVLFLDDDDRLFPIALSRLVETMRRCPHAIAAIGARVTVNDQGRRRRLPHTRLPVTRSIFPHVLLGWVPAQGQCLFRTELFRGSGAYNPTLTLCEDYELWLRVARLGKIALIPHSVLENRVHVSTVSAEYSDRLMDDMRIEAVFHLRGRERLFGARILETRALLQAANHAYMDGAFAGAFTSYFRAWKHAPFTVWLSFTGVATGIQIAKSFLGLVLGHRLVRAIKHLRDSAQQVFGRAV